MGVASDAGDLQRGDVERGELHDGEKDHDLLLVEGVEALEAYLNEHERACLKLKQVRNPKDRRLMAFTSQCSRRVSISIGLSQDDEGQDATASACVERTVVSRELRGLPRGHSER
ncbi:hypothetical protein BBJ28_00010055 [Nothophytophthora sp. Chile5]|nr:hypothetical protein BBJ28_00010055 [Nothophytophthora sp. Chile5]